jgi:hypothetical protein
MRGIEADEAEEVLDACASPRPIPQAMDDERLFDDLPSAHARVQRRVRILKHDLHVPAGLAHPLTRQREHVVTAKPDGAARRFNKAQDAASGCRLPAPGLSDETERFPLIDAEAHVVDGANGRAVSKQSSATNEFFDETGHFDERHQTMDA